MAKNCAVTLNDEPIYSIKILENLTVGAEYTKLWVWQTHINACQGNLSNIRILIENPLAGKARWENDMSIAPIIATL